MSGPSEEVTRLLLEWSGGDREALDRLVPLVAGELRKIVRRQFALERPGHTLQPTALVNEVYLRLAGRRKVQWKNRAQFFAVAAAVMREVLVDHARRRLAVKRGGGAPTIALGAALGPEAPAEADVLAVHEALEHLAEIDPRAARVVELRFFAGLTQEETAEVLGVGMTTVKTDWRFARLWLRRELEGSGPMPPDRVEAA